VTELVDVAALQAVVLSGRAGSNPVSGTTTTLISSQVTQMARKNDQMLRQRMLQERDALLRQRDAIDNEIKGLERAIALVGVSDAAAGKPQIKTVVLDLLEEVRFDGLDASTAVAMANAKGISLDRGSVSSLLSRLKRDQVITHSGLKYRLKKFSVPGAPSLPPNTSAFN
jgi:hypothetical protein